jgi:hypothetical protein
MRDGTGMEQAATLPLADWSFSISLLTGQAEMSYRTHTDALGRLSQACEASLSWPMT